MAPAAGIALADPYAQVAASPRHFLHHLNPLPRNTGDVLRRYRKVLVPEMNLGQLAMLLRAEFLVDVVSYTRVRGRPLGARELEEAIVAMVETS